MLVVRAGSVYSSEVSFSRSTVKLRPFFHTQRTEKKKKEKKIPKNKNSKVSMLSQGTRIIVISNTGLFKKCTGIYIL